MPRSTNVSRLADGEVTTLYLNVNMAYYAKIQADDVNGASSVENQGYLDRTLAHEFTHAIMAANINYFSKLPQFVKEGTAELTHGIDDERSNRIFKLGYDATNLANALNVSNTFTGDSDAYAGGYMFMRYLAKQAAANALPAFGEITATVNVAGEGIYYITGNSTTETAQVASTLPEGAIKLGELANGVYTVNDTGVHQVIGGVNQVAGLTVNDTYNGTDGNDTVTTAQGSNIITGGGDDSIDVHGQFATINAGYGSDTVNVIDGSHHSIDAGDGDNLIVFKPSANYGNTVTSGAGADTVSLGYAENNFVDLGAGNDSILFGGTGTWHVVTVTKGNDTVGTITVQTASGVTFDAETNIVTVADNHLEIDGLNYNAAGYYEIKDAQDLVDLANYVNNDNTCADMTFKVTAAIDMSSVENFAPIGNESNLFAGTFDGDGKTISNLSIDTKERGVALFSNLDASGTIKNVVLSNATVRGTYSGGYIPGALVGGLVSVNNGTVTNCKVDVQLSGIFGSNYGAIVCTNNGTVTGNTFHSNVDAVSTNLGTASDNTRVYAVNAPTGFEISDATCTGDSVTIGDKNFYKQGAQVTATVTHTDSHIVIDGESFTATIDNADATLDVKFHVQLTAGGESYNNTYSNVSVLGAAGNDIIENYGSNVTIDAGAGGRHNRQHGRQRHNRRRRR